MAAASEEEEELKKRIKEVLEEMEPLPGRISELLLLHRGRHLTVADDLALRDWEFIWVELSGIVASLRQMYSTPELGLDYADLYFQYWLYESGRLTRDIGRCLDESEQDNVRGCHAHCFSRDAGFSRLPKLRKARFMLLELAKSPYSYLHLLHEINDRNSRTPTSYEAEAGGNIILAGIEGALRNKKLRWFMANREDDEIVKVISMVGPVGVGKTALAMKVYRQLQQIRGGHYFQCCATAKVSRMPDIKELLKHILSQIDKPATLASEASIEPSPITKLQDEQELLVANINQRLKDRRYLILIDDIWKESDWNIIKDAFPRNSPGSRIMITTQLTNIARLCCSHSDDGLVHQVKPMSELDSERLLSRKAFGSDNGCPSENLKLACDEILRRCEGIPLFIIGMAEWLKEQQQDVQRVSTNYTLEKIPQLPNQFEQALYPTYDDLCCWLKVLLLTMSKFPHGHMLEKDSVIEKWISKGLINSHHTDERRVVKAEKYFSELVDRNVISRVAVATPEHTPQVEEACKWQVNYFMLQFLASKAADKGFLCTSGTLTSVVAEGGKTLRRLCLHQPDSELQALLGKMNLSHTRSLAISGDVGAIPLDKFIYLVDLDLDGWQGLKDEDMLSICKMFLLQYLSLRNTGVTKLPPEIKELRNLLTLNISHTSITELPSQVCQLDELQNLDLRSTCVRQLPEQIWNIRMLKCLLVGGSGFNHDETVTEIPGVIGKFGHHIFLNTLATVDLSLCSPSLLEVLRGTVVLEVLAITWSYHQCTDRRFQEALLSSIESWSCLKSLTIHCGLGYCMDFLDSRTYLSGDLQKFKVSGGRFARLPQWLSGLNRLTYIEITVCTLLPGDVGTVGNLPSLDCLVLGLHFIPEEAIVIDGVGFRMLERLYVSCRVPWLTFSEGAMPKLTHFELKIAGRPASEESVPSGISNLSSLSDVAIHYSKWYTNSLSVKRTVEAVRKGLAERRMAINLFINGIEDQEEYVQAAEEGPARATGSQNEIEEVEG